MACWCNRAAVWMDMCLNQLLLETQFIFKFPSPPSQLPEWRLKKRLPHCIADWFVSR